jgi:hypothetical protein
VPGPRRATCTTRHAERAGIARHRAWPYLNAARGGHRHRREPGAARATPAGKMTTSDYLEVEVKEEVEDSYEASYAYEVAEQADEAEEEEEEQEQDEEEEDVKEGDEEEGGQRREQRAQAPGASFEGRAEAGACAVAPETREEEEQEEEEEDDEEKEEEEEVEKGEQEEEEEEEEEKAEDDGNVSGGAATGVADVDDRPLKVIGVRWVSERNIWRAGAYTHSLLSST